MATSSYFNRVEFLAASPGTATFTVGTSQQGFRTLATAPAVPDGTTVSYTAINPVSANPIEWETGQGVTGGTQTTVTRATIRESSNGNAVVNFSNPPLVFLDFQAQDIAAIVASIPPATNPGGVNTNVQFNDGGAFGGVNDFTFAKSVAGSVPQTHLNGRLTVNSANMADSFIGSPVRVGWAADTNVDWLNRIAAYGNNAFSVIQLYTKTRGANADDASVALTNGDPMIEWRSYGTTGNGGFTFAGSIRFNINGTVSSGIIPVDWHFDSQDPTGFAQDRIHIVATGQTIIQFTDSNNASVFRPLNVQHFGNGTPAAGFGSGIEIDVNDSNVLNVVGATLDAIATSVTPGSVSADFVVSTMRAGTLTQAFRVDSNGNTIHNTGAVATNATNGFTYIADCAGTPTGVPTAYSGRVPLVFDATNNKFYAYNSGWQLIGPSAGGGGAAPSNVNSFALQFGMP